MNRAASVKVYRLPRRQSYFRGLEQLTRARGPTAEKLRADDCLPDFLPDPQTKFLKWLPDDAGETLNRMIDIHGVKPIVGALVQLLRDRGGSDDLFDLDATFEHDDEKEGLQKNCDVLASVIERLT